MSKFEEDRKKEKISLVTSTLGTRRGRRKEGEREKGEREKEREGERGRKEKVNCFINRLKYSLNQRELEKKAPAS